MRRLGAGVGLAALLLLAAAARAQEGEAPRARVVTIVHADSVAGEVVAGERIRTLVGSVHLRQDTTDLRAERAIQYLERDEILFEGAVEIASPSDTLEAERATYDTRARVGRAEGSVRIADAEAEVFSPSVVYDRTAGRASFPDSTRLLEREGGAVLTSRRGVYLTRSKEAFFEEDVRLEDSTSVLTSRAGRYGTEDKRADFFGDVRLQHRRSTRLEADTLTHYRDTDISVARGRVVLERFGDEDGEEAAPDTTRRTLLFGETAFHDERARYSRAEGEPLLARLEADSTGAADTLLVRARLLEAFQLDSLAADSLAADSLAADSLAADFLAADSLAADSLAADLQRLLARGDVRLWSRQLAALADSAAFERLEVEGGPPENDLRLFREPVGWLRAEGSSVLTEISGDTLHLRARSEALEALWALGRAFAARPDSALGRINQIRGRRMLALFREDSLRSIHVWPNAEAVHYRADEEGALAGAVRLSADSLAFFFAADSLRRVEGARGIEGVYYDAPLVPEPLRLEGFRYEPERRPAKDDLLGGRPLEAWLRREEATGPRSERAEEGT